MTVSKKRIFGQNLLKQCGVVYFHWNMNSSSRCFLLEKGKLLNWFVKNTVTIQHVFGDLVEATNSESLKTVACFYSQIRKLWFFDFIKVNWFFILLSFLYNIVWISSVISFYFDLTIKELLDWFSKFKL